MGRKLPGLPGSMTSSTSMATRLAAAVISVSLLALVVATYVGLTTGRDLGRDLFTSQLQALRTTAEIDTTAALNALARATTATAQSPQAAIAIEEFSEGFDELDQDLGPNVSEYSDRTNELLVAYDERYVEPQAETGRPLEFREILAGTPAAVYLQSEYSVPDVAEEPDAIDDAEDGSAWSASHLRYHPVYREIADRMGVVDLFLVAADDRTVVYSVGKGPELGTSLRTGPYSGTALSRAVNRVLREPELGTFTSDVSFYPTTLQPVGVSASPVFEGDRVVGVLAAMYDSDRLTEVLTADGEWSDAGYPDTSNTYLSGSDGTTRSEPRGFIEDPIAFLDAAQASGQLTDDQRAVIEARNTTVLTLQIDEATLIATRDDDETVTRRESLMGAEVYSTTAGLEAERTPSWWVIAEIDTAIASSDLDDFRELLIVGVAIFVVVLAFAAVAWANGIVRPVRRISDRLADAEGRRAAATLDETPAPLEVPDRSPIEFHRLAASFESMAESLRAQRSSVAAARAERLALLRQMLPPTIAQRVAEGQIQALEEIPQVTVGVALVEGLGGLVEINSESSSRDVVDRLLAELDELAHRHGIERVKVVGDAYFAACGHDRPYLDHAPRLVSFAMDARDAVRELSAGTGASGFDLAAGIHTGPVTVGMTGTTRLVYDVWGATVTLAHEVARRAAHGQILVTDATRQLLPESVDVDRADGSGDDDLGVWAVEPSTVRGPA